MRRALNRVACARGSFLSIAGAGLQEPLGAESTAGRVADLVGGLVALATVVWYAVLVVIGASLARRIGFSESAGSWPSRAPVAPPL